MKDPITPVRFVIPFAAAAAFAISAHAQDKPPAPAEEAAPPKAEAKAEARAVSIDLKDPVAVVNGEEISKTELEAAFKEAIGRAGVDTKTLTADQQLAGYKKLLDDLVVDHLVKAKSVGIEVSDADVDAEIGKIKTQFPTEDAFKEQLKQSGQTEEKLTGLIKVGLKQRKWMESQLGEGGKVSDEEAKKFYDENTKQFEQPETVRANHILYLVPEGATDEVLKEKEAAAKKALERAKKGEDFTALAKELSEEPGAKESGGDLNFFTKEQMVPEFANAAFAMKVGEISEPVKSQFGYHIIKVTDKKPAGTMKFDEVKPKLVAFLENQKQQKAVTELIDKVRKEADIKINLPDGASAN